VQTPLPTETYIVVINAQTYTYKPEFCLSTHLQERKAQAQAIFLKTGSSSENRFNAEYLLQAIETAPTARVAVQYLF
jgi:hypothetical protein